MNILFKYEAGSQAYGLSTPTSDTDVRGVYIVDDLNLILNPYAYMASRQKCKTSIEDGLDESYHELRHFFNILYNANTNALEMLWVDNYEHCSPLFKRIRAARYQLINPERFYKSLKGYMQGELRLALGERTGKLGGKRYDQVLKYGFSPKNFVQLLRLAHVGTRFFKAGHYAVDMMPFINFRTKLMSIKTEPATWSKEHLIAEVAAAEKELDQTYNANIFNINRSYRYDEKLATQFMLEAYHPILTSNLPKKSFFSIFKK